MTTARKVTLAAGLLAAGCGAIPEQSRDRTACAPLFIEYDRVAQFAPEDARDPMRGNYVLDSRLSQLTVLLIQNDCQTRSRDLVGLEEAAEARGGRGISEGGESLGRPVAVQVGMLTDEGDAARAQAFFRELGLQTTSIGVQRLGRRVYAGPVFTVDGLNDLTGLARVAGFVAPYPSAFYRF